MAETPVWKVAHENTDEANFLEQTVNRSVRCARQALFTECALCYLFILFFFLGKGEIINVLTCDSGDLVNERLDL